VKAREAYDFVGCSNILRVENVGCSMKNIYKVSIKNVNQSLTSGNNGIGINFYPELDINEEISLDFFKKFI
jgi:hypothetical protein